MLKLIILGIFSFSVFAKAPSNYSQLRSEISKTTSRSLTQLLNEFVRASAPSRFIGQEGHSRARLFLKQTIEKFDAKKTGKIVEMKFAPSMVEAQRFYQEDFNQKVEGKVPKTHPDYHRYQKFTKYAQELALKYKDVQGENIIWQKEGVNTNKVLILTAHYDTITQDPATLTIKENGPMPGANYNASGVSVALAILKLLAENDLNYSVQVTFLDWQGIAFLGSYAYANELKNSGKEILGVINLEMLGQDTTYLDKNKKLGNLCAYSRANPVEEVWVRKLLSHGQQITSKVQFELRPNNFENSDNVRFWEQGFLSATFSQNWEDDFNLKFYQTSQDTPETLNHETLYSSYQYLAGATLGTLLDLSK